MPHTLWKIKIFALGPRPPSLFVPEMAFNLLKSNFWKYFFHCIPSSCLCCKQRTLMLLVHRFLLLCLLIFFKPESLASAVTNDGANDFFPPRGGRSVCFTLRNCSWLNASSAVSTTKPPTTALGTVAKRSSSMQRTSHGGESIHQPPLVLAEAKVGPRDRHHLLFELVLWTKRA
jgi:hypothetical protein